MRPARCYPLDSSVTPRHLVGTGGGNGAGMPFHPPPCPPPQGGRDKGMLPFVLIPSPLAGEGQGEGERGPSGLIPVPSLVSVPVSGGTRIVGLTARQSSRSWHHSTPPATWGVPARQSSLRHNAQVYPGPPSQHEEARTIEAQREPTINLMHWAGGWSRGFPYPRNFPIQLPQLADHTPEPLTETPTEPPEEGPRRQG